MQSTQDMTINPALVPAAAASAATSQATAASALGDYRIIRRNGAVVAFEPSKIAIAVTKAFLAVNGGHGAASARVRDEVAKLTDVVVAVDLDRLLRTTRDLIAIADTGAKVSVVRRQSRSCGG